MPDGADHKENQDIFTNYFRFVSDTEPPVIYHRWSYLTSLSALLGRKVHVELGHFRIFPNLYVMLLGEPATRKSTSIKMVKRLVAGSGYSTFAFDKTGKEKFLLDLEGVEDDTHLGPGNTKMKDKDNDYDTSTTAQNLWGDESGEPREVFIVADEFNEFIKPGDTEFHTTLGNMWDWDNESGAFTQRLKTSRSVSIFQPTITLLSGSTPDLFAKAFPPEAIGTGFLSRMLLIHGERSGRRIPFPSAPDSVLGASISAYFAAVRDQAGRGSNSGLVGKSVSATEMLSDIYMNPTPIPDLRFKAYNERRFTQLLKLCLILAVAKFKAEIGVEEVIQANTYLTHAEFLMPKAMGEFGKNQNSDIANRVVDYLDRATKPISMKELWSEIGRRDLKDQRELASIVGGLVAGDKVQVITGQLNGFLPKKQVRKIPRHVDWSLLSKEEEQML